MNYSHTHASVHDNSPAMLQWRDANTLHLVNEDGHEWTDHASQWRPIGPARVISDDSGHNLPIGAVVTLLDPADLPEDWQRTYGVLWYTQGGDGDEVAIDPVDLMPVTP